MNGYNNQNAKEVDKPLKRIGDLTKCPACGWQVDSEAYRCAKCNIDFCYVCRKRIRQGDLQIQCLNKECSRHGKLVCDGCVNYETVRDAVKDGGVVSLVLAVSLGAAAWYYSTFLVAALLSLCVFLAAGVLMRTLGYNFFTEDLRDLTSERYLVNSEECKECGIGVSTNFFD